MFYFTNSLVLIKHFFFLYLSKHLFIMKKVFTLFLFAISLSPAISQTCEGVSLLSENFDNSNIPATWNILDLDGNTLYWNMPSKGWTGQWQPYYHMGKKCAANTCRFTSSAPADDYLITPAITLGTGTICLSWNGASQYSFSPETYEVRISTTTPDDAGMQANPALDVITSDAGNWTEHTLDISAYAGQTVYIGFWYNSSGTYSAYIDDIRISSPVNLDAKISSVNMRDVLLPSVAQTISGNLLNGGLTSINSFDLNWKIDNGPVNTMNVPAANIAPASYYNYSHNLSWTAPSNGTYKLKIWASNINGSNDQNTFNDTLTRTVFVSSFPRKSLLEEFTQASCPPCATQNPHFDSLIYQNRVAGKVTSLQYHTVWPGVDPMNAFNQLDVEQQVQYYGVGGVPTGTIDGIYIPDSCTLYEGAPGCLTQTMIDNVQSEPSIFDVQIASVKNGNTGNVTVTVTAKNDFTMGTFRLMTTLEEDTILYGTPPGTNGEMEFFQVMRYLIPDSDGVFLPAMIANQSLSFNSSFIVDPSFVESQLRVIAFIQDDATRKVYQSKMTATPYTVTGVAENYFNTDNIFIYPNPVQEHAQVIIAGMEGEVTMTIRNILSQEILYSFTDNISSDNYKTNINIGAIPAGMYFAEFDFGGKKAVRKFMKL